MKKIIKLLIIITFIVLSSILVYSINKLGLVPNKYLYIGIAGLVILNLIAALLLLSKKLIPKIFSILIYILLLFAIVSGFYVCNTTNNFLDKAFNNVNNELVLNYYILSTKEIKKEDLKDRNVYYLDNIDYVKDAIAEINKNYKPNMIPSIDIEEVINQEIFMLDKSTISLLTESYNFDINKYYIIDVLELKYEIETPKATTDSKKHYYNIFVGGHDFSGIHMDMNKIITVNTETREVLITNIHRFTYLDVPGYNQKNTLSSMGVWGVNNNVKALEQELGITIDYYLVADAEGLPILIDDVGGIEYCSDIDFVTYHKTTLDYKNDTGYNVHVKKGCQHLNGIETLTVARERLAFKYGAAERDKNDTEIMIDILEAMKKPSNITNYSSILNDVSGLYTTSIPREVMTNGIKELLNSKIIISKQELDGRNGTDRVNFSNMKGAVVYVDEASKQEVISKIKSLDK